LAFQPLCSVTCVEDDPMYLQCVACSNCRVEGNSQFYNILDGACVTNEQYGTIAGLGFALVFASMGLFAGHFSDVMDRRRLHTAAVLLWSTATAGQSSCMTYGCLLTARIAVGLGMAFNAPACYSVIAYHFRATTHRAVANGIYSTGTYLGCAISSLCIIVAKQVGWRETTFLSGLVGIAMAGVLYFTVDQPSPNQPQAEVQPLLPFPVPLETSSSSKHDKSASFAVDHMYTLLTNPRVLLLIAAASVRSSGGWIISAYLPIYYSRAFVNMGVQFGVINGLIVGTGGMFSSYVGGVIAARWGDAFPGGVAWLPAVSSLSALVPMTVTLYAKSFNVSLVAWCLQVVLAECWLGPGMTILQMEVPPDAMGLAVTILLFANTVIAAAFGPYAVSMLDPGTADVRWPIMTQIAVSYAGSAALFGLIGVWLQRRAPHHGAREKQGGGGDYLWASEIGPARFRQGHPSFHNADLSL
jgi:predicted MFS family arabinose efflux permease